jgi:hypothetical protein
MIHNSLLDLMGDEHSAGGFRILINSSFSKPVEIGKEYTVDLLIQVEREMVLQKSA